MSITLRKPICKRGHDKTITGMYPGGHCRACRRSREYREKCIAWKKENPEKVKAIGKRYYIKVRDTKLVYHTAYNLKAALKRYDIPLENYTRALEVQNNTCKICLKPAGQTKRLAIDHNHKTGKFRGLLCDTCNRALGYAQDSKIILQNMIQYLEETNS